MEAIRISAIDEQDSKLGSSKRTAIESRNRAKLRRNEALERINLIWEIMSGFRAHLSRKPNER